MFEHEVLKRARNIEDQIVAWRRDIHQHPELGFQEYRTAQLVAETLRSMGYEVQTGVGKTGVVASIGEGNPDAGVVAIRADMDALPVQELNDVHYRSQVDGKMHACGHDAHTAMLLGAARILTDLQKEIKGEIRLLFQPCEETEDDEGKSGAYRMIEDRAMEGVNKVIALHVASDLPVGKIVVDDGFASAAADSFRAVIKGEGTHGAHPDHGVDPIFVLAQVINAIHGIRARRINPVRHALISIGSVHGGQGDNVIPDSVKITGTIRSYDDETREKLWVELEAALAVSRAFGGDYELHISKGCPSIINDRAVTESIKRTTTELLGADVLMPHEKSMGGEDFSYMTRKAPGSMFLLGAKRDTVNRPHHSPIFDIDESVFAVGAAMLVSSALNLMNER
jgi:amidohydrolase